MLNSHRHAVRRLVARSAHCFLTASAIVAAVGTLAPIALAAQAAAPTIKLSHLQGTVLDPLDNPLTKVIIEIDDPAMATFTDESGFFRLRNIPAGARTIRVKKIGFDGVDFELDLLADSTVHIGVKLQPVAQTLGTVTVLTKEEESHPALAATGFYAQKRAGFGTLFSPEEIEKKKESVNDASSMFRDVLGVTLRRERTGGANLQGKPSGGGSIQKGIQTVCMMNVLKDGMFMKINPGETFDQIVSKDEVYAIEVYPRAEYTPAAYHVINGNDLCGTVVIWTVGHMTLKPKAHT